MAVSIDDIKKLRVLETELVSGRHTLCLRIAKGERTGCQIRNFVVNQ